MAVLAATFTTSIVFFPVTFFTGVSKYIFTPLALGVVLSIFASYFFAMTVVPLYCARFINVHDEEGDHKAEADWRVGALRSAPSTTSSRLCSTGTSAGLPCDAAPWLLPPASHSGRRRRSAACSLSLFLGRAYFPRTDPGQFIINVRMPSGTRLEVSNDYVAKVEKIIRSEVNIPQTWA